ncbi:MAG: pantoate--beta-alanine ligase, partial [Bifidobacteriaceae bacterium]|nr:pantoate--beta-alanine ligase [Bifidobacteriaceae bacterium]
PRALEAAVRAAERGLGAAAVRAAARDRAADLGAAGAFDYLDVVSPGTFEPLEPGQSGRALAIGALRVGSTRLIDNQPLAIA